ncbi:hypothetical protein AsACE_CH01358 [Acinetobacter schindleri]|nr:hypothetical protein AsACE_CH01358 [Acinetobacter schindleri]
MISCIGFHLYIDPKSTSYFNIYINLTLNKNMLFIDQLTLKIKKHSKIKMPALSQHFNLSELFNRL